jgi:hypothetical protein
MSEVKEPAPLKAVGLKIDVIIGGEANPNIPFMFEAFYERKYKKLNR